VLAVDPSSPFSGGALLGDRVRLADHALDPEVFIRSMASRGHLGGLSRATPQALRVLQAAGCGVVLVETVGVGQSEVEVAGLADTTLVLLAPGMGDGIQAAKAGILEIGDVFVVNKADRDGAAATARDLRHMVGWSDPDLGSAPARAGGSGGSPVRPAGWRPPVVRTVASTGFGSTELMAALDAHLTWLSGGGGLADRRRRRAAVEIEALVLAGLRSRLGELGRAEHLDTLAEDVVAGRADPYRAADRLIEALTG
jgi:LAO/AO transport system kinase